MRRFRQIRGLALAITLLALIPIAPAVAGERNTGVWEGVAIGLGAGLVLNALSHPAVVYYQPVPPPVVYYEPAPPPVIYPYLPARTVVVPTLRYYSVYRAPYGLAHGY